jgi:hypothetical protein
MASELPLEPAKKMASWISGLSNQVTASISQIEKTLDASVSKASSNNNNDHTHGEGDATALEAATTNTQSWEARAIAAEQRAEGLLKEGLALAEKQGKSRQTKRTNKLHHRQGGERAAQGSQGARRARGQGEGHG